MNRSPLSASDRRLMAMPSIASQMPVQFKSGACWELFDGQCKACGKAMAPGRVTGQLSRLVESVVTVEGVGVCDPCKLVTRFHYRLHDDKRTTGMTDEGWAMWQARPTVLDRLRAFLARATA